MIRRYELSDADWSLVVGEVTTTNKTGRPRNNDRLMLNGILWILYSGATWRDLPERFGAWSTVYQRYRDCRDDGTLEHVLSRLKIRPAFFRAGHRFEPFDDE
jgi:transposase